jgi:hypothetical protein
MKTFMLSFAVVSAFAFAAALPTSLPAAAAEYAWCLRTAGFAGSDPKCRYATFEQCQSASAFSQGWCERNSRVVSEDMQANQRGRSNR